MANGDGLRQNQSDRYAMAKRNFTKVKRICFSKQRNEDPGRRNTLQRVKEWEEYFQRRAIREGFSGWEEYIARKDETDPTMCRLTYKLYKECLSENETYCHLYRNKCPEFEQAPKGHSAVDSTS